MPAYNVEPYIGEALRSALAQTFIDLEVIVVDDGSTDGTADVAAGVAAADPRVRLVRQENRGLAGARNTALRMARGDVFGRGPTSTSSPATAG
jgi:glycosyltransferase involved in cell wall biosynthesis